MGLFGSLFKPKTEQYSPDERKLILVLLSVRLKNLSESQGHSSDEAMAITERTIKSQDLSGDRILGVPDGMIVKIIRDFIKNMSANLAEAKRQNIKVDLAGRKKLILEHIERNRNAVLGMSETSNIPPTLDAYIHFRVRREVEFIYKTDPEVMGFTRETVQLMVNIAKEVYRSKADFQR